jgi:hypothetical protein
MLIKFERRDPSLPKIERVHVPRVPEREMTPAEANMAILDGFFAMMYLMIALFFLLNGLASIFDASLLATFAALLWTGAAFLTARGSRIGWWVQLPLAAYSLFVLMRSFAALGQ